ncbi:Acyl-CoA--sterol O-acyltransferase 1 [Linum grandiflorum]
MEGGEIDKFIKVWISILISLTYCYAIPNSIPKGPKRLVSILPVVALFLYLPLHLNSIHLGGITAFFIAWLANFKLLLFSFGKGPLSNYPDNNNNNNNNSHRCTPLSLPSFIAVSCLPIKIQLNKNSSATGSSREGPLNYTLKALSVAVLIRAYDYSDSIHPKLLLILYGLHTYFMLDLILAVSAAGARNILGLEMEPHFDEPYLSTSLQEFWGRRWNLIVNRILRPTVYDPIRARWAPLPAVFATFVVSALMHELILYYMTRTRPNWKMAGFFLLHGACVAAEIVVKKATKQRQLPMVVSRALTVGFVLATGIWLFFPKFAQCRLDVKASQEYAAFGEFVITVTQRVVSFVRPSGR